MQLAAPLAAFSAALCFFAATLLAGCITHDGYATDTIARIYHENYPGCERWNLQLTNDHPIDGDTMTYGIAGTPGLLERLQDYAAKGTRVSLHYTHRPATLWCEREDIIDSATEAV